MSKQISTIDLAKAVAALESKAGDVAMGIFFPMPHHTPAKQKKAVLDTGRKAYALMTQAEEAGDAKTEKKARAIAVAMREKLDLLASRKA